MERPNTVAGLVAKRKELMAFRAGLEADLRRVSYDLEHLDAAIRLFQADSAAVDTRRYMTGHRARQGELRRFVLDHLRQAGHAVTSRELAEQWMTKRGLRPDDRTFVVFRERIGGCLIKLRAEGLVRNGEGRGGYQGYELA